MAKFWNEIILVLLSTSLLVLGELVPIPTALNGTFDSIHIDPPVDCNYPWGSFGAMWLVVPLWTLVPDPSAEGVSISSDPYDYVVPYVNDERELRFEFRDTSKLINGPSSVGIRIELPPDMLVRLFVGGQNHVQIRNGFTHLSNITQTGASVFRGNLTDLVLEGGNDSLFLTVSDAWLSRLELEGTSTVPAVLDVSGKAIELSYKGHIMDGSVRGLGGQVLIEGVVDRLDVKDENYITVSGDGTCSDVYRGMRSLSWCKETRDEILAEDMGEISTSKEILQCSGTVGRMEGLLTIVGAFSMSTILIINLVL